MKKIVTVVSSVVMTMAMAVSAFAAGSVSATEQKVINELKAKNVPAELVSEAENYFVLDGVDVTEAEATQIIADIDDAAAIAEKNNLKTVDDILAADEAIRKEILAKVNHAADILDVTVVVDTKSKNVTIKDNTGKVIATTNVGTKPTGASSMSTVVVISGLGLAVAALAVASKNAKAEA